MLYRAAAPGMFHVERGNGDKRPISYLGSVSRETLPCIGSHVEHGSGLNGSSSYKYG